MTVEEFMQTDYTGATLADFVQSVSFDWVEYEKDLGLNVEDDMLTEIKISDTDGKELADLLPFDKDHPPNKLYLHTWQKLFDRSIIDVHAGDGFSCDYEIILQ